MSPTLFSPRDARYALAVLFAVNLFNYVDRQMIGVLDVSSDSYLPPAHTLGMVKMMSQSVENRLILNLFKDDYFQLSFNTSLDNLDSQWAGVLLSVIGSFLLPVDVKNCARGAGLAPLGPPRLYSVSGGGVALPLLEPRVDH